ERYAHVGASHGLPGPGQLSWGNAIAVPLADPPLRAPTDGVHERPAVALEARADRFGMGEGLRPVGKAPARIERAVAQQLRLATVRAVIAELARDAAPPVVERPEGFTRPGVEVRASQTGCRVHRP